MRTATNWGCPLLALAIMASAGLLLSAEEKKPKYTIKEVMKEAHKSGLLKKVTSGKGSSDDCEKLFELYTALAQNKPPKGDLDDWKERTNKMVLAARDVRSEKIGAEKKLARTVNCTACHSLHRPKE